GVVTRLWSRSHDSAPHSPKSPRPRNLYYGRLAERHPSEAVPALHIRRYARTAMSASTPGSGPPTGREPALDSRPLTRGWSRALVGGMALAVAAVAIVHLAATFVYNAPANPVSQRYARSVNWWMEPLFSQNWRLFAPNPISENVEIDARASLDPDGRLTGWVDLSAQDQAAVRGNPVPGHIAENELRNAWFQWLQTHDGNGNPTGAKADVMQKYLLSVVLNRLGGH